MEKELQQRIKALQEQLSEARKAATDAETKLLEATGENDHLRDKARKLRKDSEMLKGELAQLPL